MLDRLDAVAVDATAIETTPVGLDEVFLALTVHPRSRGRSMTAMTRSLAVKRLADDVPPQPAPHLRYPSMTVLLIGMPVLLLLLFVYVFGGTLGAGLPRRGRGRRAGAAYLDYVTPAIVHPGRGLGRSGHGDQRRHGHDRGHRRALPDDGDLARVGARPATWSAPSSSRCSPWRTLLLVAIALGFRPAADPVALAALGGILTLTAFALTWLSVALGLVHESVETASNLPMFLIFLPFLGSGFVPVESMPGRAGVVCRAPALHADHRDRAEPPRHRNRRVSTLLLATRGRWSSPPAARLVAGALPARALGGGASTAPP